MSYFEICADFKGPPLKHGWEKRASALFFQSPLNIINSPLSIAPVKQGAENDLFMEIIFGNFV